MLVQISELLSKGEFQLWKWCSNIPRVLPGMPKEDRDSYLTFDDGSNFTKMLGLAWDSSPAAFFFSSSVHVEAVLTVVRSYINSAVV